MPNEMIGKYEILEKRGEGGFGVLYKAMDTMIERVVALKVLHPQYASNERLSAWFKREAKAMARLNHQNIVTIHNFEIEGERHFIVMEYVDGENLSEMISKAGPLSIDDTLNVLLQLVDGFGYAHKGGIIHRDIKPSNIMIDQSGKAKITDFGIAKILGDTKLTKTGSGAGSLHYMSPEQIEGKVVDVRADIYSLGITMYHMVTGKVPFTDESEFVIMRAHLDQEPTPPSQLRSDIPPSLEKVILRMLAKRPEDRYDSMKTLSGEIRQVIDHSPAGDRTIRVSVPDATVPETPIAQGPMIPDIKETKERKRINPLLGVMGIVVVALVASYLAFFRGGESPVDDSAVIDSSAVAIADSMSADAASSDSAMASADSVKVEPGELRVQTPVYKGKLVIDVSPFDYRDRPTVRFGGKSYEIDDIPFEIGSIEPGRHRIAVHYKDKSFFEDIRFDDDVQSRTYKFNGATGRVSIGAEFIGQDKQPWAEILVDGKLLDQGTPASIDLIEGPHKVEVRKNGFELVGGSKIVYVKAGENNSVSFKLRRK